MALRRASLPILVLALSCLALLVFGQSRAEARTYSTATSFGFNGYPDAFLGQIASNNDRCRSGRLVKVFRERGRRDRLIGRDRASGTGQWKVERDVPTARYYAKVPRLKFGPGRRHVCRAYKTSTMRVG